MKASKGEETRARLLHITIDALRDLEVEDLLSAVGTREIARRAGVSAGTLFHHFDSVEGLADAVLNAIYDPDWEPAVQGPRQVSHIASSPTLPQDSMAFHRSEFNRLLDDPRQRVRVGLWAFGGDEARSRYGSFLRLTDASYAAGAREYFDNIGQEMRPPFTVEDLVAAHVSLVRGAVIHAAADRDAADPDRHARSATALSLVMMRTPGDDRDLDDQLIVLMGRRDARAGLPADVRARALAVAEALFVELGYETTSLVGIARAAGVGATTLYKAFGSKAQVALDLIARRAEEMVSPDPERRCADVVAVMIRCASYLEPLLVDLALGNAVDDAHPLVAALAEDGAEAGSIGEALLVLGRRVRVAGASPPPETVDALVAWLRSAVTVV